MKTGSEPGHRLKEFRNAQAYVLLGDPGAGKTTAFEAECEAMGNVAKLVEARRFLRDELDQWRDKVLFIDGLDEVRAGGADHRSAIDGIIRGLGELGHPRFRLSCRPAQWLLTDTKELSEVVPETGVAVLRLEGLSTDSAKRLVDGLVEERPERFWHEIRGRGLDYSNPLTLMLLAEAFAAEGTWPVGRQETFQVACHQMARERNQEHLDGRRGQDIPAPDDVIRAAGLISAVLLISDTSAVMLDGETTRDGASLHDLRHRDMGGANQQALAAAVGSRLFSSSSPGRFEPIHRSVAEFLAGRYLADQVNGGTGAHALVASRVVAFLVGEDGATVPALRGVAAWLATFSPAARQRLIHADPEGVALYGDFASLSQADTHQVLDFLIEAGETKWFDLPDARRVITRHTVAWLGNTLRGPNRSQGIQVVARNLLDRMATDTFTEQQSSIPYLEVIRDGTWHITVREAALKAWLCSPTSCDRPDGEEMTALMDEIVAEEVADESGDLLGRLLHHLYPRVVGPRRVWNYLRLAGQPGYFGWARTFWGTDLGKKSAPEHLPALVDGLLERADDKAFIGALSESGLERAMVDLVFRAVREHGDRYEPARIYDWLDLVRRITTFQSNPSREIVGWMAERQELHRELLKEGLKRCPPGDDFRDAALEVEDAVSPLGTIPQSLLLDTAVEMVDAYPDAACQLLEWTGVRHDTPTDAKPFAAEARRRVRGYAILEAHLDRLLSPPKPNAKIERLRAQEREYLKEQKKRHEEEIRYLGDHLEELRAGTIRFDALEILARERLSVERNPDLPLRERLRERFDGREDLVEATLSGLARVPARDDIPSDGDIVATHAKNQRFLLSLPFLVGLEERERRSGDALADLAEARIRSALAFLFVSLEPEDDPPWYRRLCKDQPEVVADVLLTATRSALQVERTGPRQLSLLDRDSAHAGVAKVIAPRLLELFPVHMKKTKYQERFKLALRLSIRHAREQVLRTAEERLGNSRLAMWQGAMWLGSGLLLDPTQYTPSVAEFVEGGSEARPLAIADFLLPYGSGGVMVEECQWGATDLELLIRAMASRVDPWLPKVSSQPMMATIISPAADSMRKASELVRVWTMILGGDPSNEARDALERLVADPALKAWRQWLREAQDRQVLLHRDAARSLPAVNEVIDALTGGPPANPADLTAIVMEHLTWLTKVIRDGDTNDWRQYWDGIGGPSPKPKKENDCRDVLVSALRPRLNAFTTLETEARYAEDKRPDIRARSGAHAVPIEVKRILAADLWSGIERQLIPRYTRDPECDGYGVYLVFWFGRDHLKTPPPRGHHPNTADELRGRLEDTIPDDKRGMIKVAVIDVSRPD